LPSAVVVIWEAAAFTAAVSTGVVASAATTVATVATTVVDITEAIVVLELCTATTVLDL
jgi:hypothetical protein